ncbi:MAG: CarD family transcriptional regulator [Nitrospinota bacterium]|nr:CarD family transcriptional regulator [Nitrospinota bacterium]MDH5756428.1 CarD family transcriptional regulator [Nitrospinota bacterium]
MSLIRFKVGSRVVYPSHGLGTIEKIEQLKVSGMADAFYIIRLRKSGMTIMAPTRSAGSLGLRSVITKKEVPKILSILGNGIMDNVEPNWNKRQKRFLEMIKTGALSDVAHVYRALFKLKASKGLSFVEQQVFDNAYELIVSEIAEAKGVDKDKAAIMVGKALSN